MREGLQLYRGLLKAVQRTFSGDTIALESEYKIPKLILIFIYFIFLEAKERIRGEFISASQLSDPTQLLEKQVLAKEVILFLRKNVAQGKLTKIQKGNMSQGNSRGASNITECQRVKASVTLSSLESASSTIEDNRTLVYSYKITQDHEMTDNAPTTDNDSIDAEGSQNAGAATFTKKILKPLGPCRVRCDDCSCGAPP